jgi:hypothetical protein
MIIFNQKKQYDNLIKNGFEKYPNFRDLMILAKEWFFIEKFDKNDIKNKLNEFCKEKFEHYDEYKSINLIKKVINKLGETQNYTELPEKLTFYKEEIDEILKIKNKNWQKLIYIFCCLSKLKKSDGIYLNANNSMKLCDVFELAQVKLSKNKQDLVLNDLYNAGFLSVDLRPLLKYHPLCLKTEGNILFEIESSSNLLSEFIKLNGTPTIKCLICGKVIEKKKNNQKYCPECALEVHRENAKKLKKLRSKK